MMIYYFLRIESLVRKDLVSQDVFGVLLSCLSSSNPWRALLAHSITFRNPILAVLASCCQVNLKYGPFVLYVCLIKINLFKAL